MSSEAIPATSPARRLGPEDAAIFDTFVVPRYLSLFAERLVASLVKSTDARVCHLFCRTGFPDRDLVAALPGAHVFGCDRSEHAIDLARAKASMIVRKNPSSVFDYRVVQDAPLPFPRGAFSHAFTIHPVATAAERKRLLEEMARIVAPRGQAIFAMPLRGSFVEVVDLLREHVLKFERSDLGDAVETAVHLRPTADMLARELEAAGFEFVDVDVKPRTLTFGGGRGFFEDPVTRMLVVPELSSELTAVDLEKPLAYVRDAIDKYWSEEPFELHVNVGVASGRRRS